MTAGDECFAELASVSREPSPLKQDRKKTITAIAEIHPENVIIDDCRRQCSFLFNKISQFWRKPVKLLLQATYVIYGISLILKNVTIS